MKWRNRMLSALLAGTLVIGGVPFSGAIAVNAADASFAGEEWYDQIDKVEINREPAHAYFTPYESAAKALTNEKSALDEDAEGSAWQMSLNGDWKFKFAQKPADREKKAKGAAAASYEENWDTAQWDTIKVPSSIQTIKNEDGTFKYEKPLYVNTRYPWRNYESVSLGANVTAPTVNNSVGHYKRTFTIPENWDGRDVFVNFEGVESAFYLYVNGKRVGYAEDSYTTDEFNITSYLKKGENTIAVEVYRWSTGSFLENQDFIRYSGIFRDVNLYSKDQVEVRDVFIRTDLDEEFKDATLELDASIRNLGDAAAAGKAYKVTADLYEIDGKTKVWSSPLEIAVKVPAAKETVEAKADDEGITVTGSKAVANPKKWYADTPNLYMLLIELKDETGKTVETLCQRVGFREIGKVDISTAGQEQAQINGKKIMFRGTNRHENNILTGRAISKDDIKTDLFMMKEFNVNAIRTSHYPNNPYTYALADEIGLYICDETNAESHEGATGSDIPSGFPIWNNSVMDRTKNMVERDKNHPCVVIWSLGNEATYKVYTMDDNFCFYNSTRWILERDPSRLRKYERDNRYTKGDREHSMVDIYSSQYWGVSSVEGHVANTNNKAPYIQSEYSHAMGNGLGNFKEYWDVFRSYPNGQGGFIWDWIDQAVETKVEEKEKHIYYINDPNTGTRVRYDGKFLDGRNGTQAIKGVYTPQGSGSKCANSDALTVDVWLKVSDTFTASQQTFISKGDDDGYNLQISAKGELEFYVDGWTGGVITAAVPKALTDKDGNWHRITGTISGQTYKLFFDGKEIATKQRNSSKAAYDTNTKDIAIGTNADYTSRVFNGMIDRAAIIKGALTEEELTATADSLDSVKDDIVYAIDFAKGIAEDEVIVYDADTYLGYGGDWGETVTDNDFCANGIVNADRTPSPELYEVKKVHQEVSFYDDGKAAEGEVRIVNEFLNTNVNKYNISWTVKENDKLIGEGALTEAQKDIAPLAEKTVKLSGFPTIDAVQGSDYVLTFSVTLKEDEAWAGTYGGNAGQEIAFEEFELSYEDAKPQPALDSSKMGKVTVADTDESVTVTGKTATTGGKDFEVVVDKATGYISSYKVDGKTLLKNGPVPDYYRAPSSNDPAFSAVMKEAADRFTVGEGGITVNKRDKVVMIHVPGTISGVDSENNFDYAIYGDGRIVVTNTFTPSNSVGDIAKIGMKMTVPEGYEKYTYYGNGPQESYPDRKDGTKLAVYESTVTDQFESKYVKPQENANRTGVRWAALRAEDGTGILVSAADQMETSALHYKAEDLAGYRHPYQVPKQKDTILSVALVSRGLGGASCGPGPLSKYIIAKGQTYSHTFSISPITEPTENQALMTRSKVNEETSALSGIKVDGVELKSFASGKTDYDYVSLKGSSGSKVPTVEAIKKSDDVTVEITPAKQIPGDTVIRAVSAFGVEYVYTIHFKETDQIYISDMEWLVNNSGYHQNARDMCGCTNAGGDKISVYVDGEKKDYKKGVGMHATAEICVQVDGTGADTFAAQIGISADQGQTNKSNVHFVVKGDGEELFRKNEVLAGQSFPMSVDIKGVKLLTLIVDMNGTDANDHGVWADAKIFKKTSVESIAVTADKTELKVGEKAQASAEITPDYASVKEVTWSSSNDKVATVNANGQITAVAEGEADITATANDGSDVSGKIHIKVTKVLVETITVKADKTDLKVGEKAKATVTVAPNNASVKEVAWTSSNDKVATVDANGQVTAVAEGEADITATAKDGSDVSGKVHIKVTKIVLAEFINVTADKTILTVGDTAQASVTVAPENAESKEVEWSSSNTNVATVDANGKITAIAAGNADIIATAKDGSNVSGKVQIQVADKVPDKVLVQSITVSADKADLTVGDKAQAKAVVAPANATIGTVAWSSSNAAVATVDAAGVITAVAAGEADIVATAQDGSNVTGSVHVKVTAPAAPAPTALSAPASVKVISTVSGVKITFAKVENAASYNIYRKSGSGSAKKIANVTNTSYVDAKAPGGKKSSYKVIAVSGSDAYTNSASSKSVSVTLLKAVSSPKAKAVKGGVKITFKKVKGVKSYIIYRANKKNGKFTKVATTTKSSYTDKKAKKGKNYYRIVGKKGSAYSPASKIVSANVKK